jgi:hypothetical protein
MITHVPRTRSTDWCGNVHAFAPGDIVAQENRAIGRIRANDIDGYDYCPVCIARLAQTLLRP